MSAWRRRHRAIEKYNKMSDIRDMIDSTGIFHERSTGRFYLGEKIRVRIVPMRQKGYIAIWEVLKIGYVNPKPWLYYKKAMKIEKEDWFEVSLEELIAKYLDKEDAKLFLFNLDVFLELE
jgi:hypothetical protein